MKVVSFKADEADIARWKEEAYQARITFGEFARQKMNGGVPAAPALLEALKPKVKKCDHRLPPGTYCKSCMMLKR